VGENGAGNAGWIGRFGYYVNSIFVMFSFDWVGSKTTSVLFCFLFCFCFFVFCFFCFFVFFVFCFFVFFLFFICVNNDLFSLFVFFYNFHKNNGFLFV
jgi:hypothetical protein